MITFTQSRNIADYLLDSLYGERLRYIELDPHWELKPSHVDEDALEFIWQKWGRMDGEWCADTANEMQLMVSREEWDQLLDDPIAARQRVNLLLSREWLEHNWESIHDAIAVAIQERIDGEIADAEVDRYMQQGAV